MTLNGHLNRIESGLSHHVLEWRVDCCVWDIFANVLDLISHALGLNWSIRDTFVDVLVLFSSNRLIYLFSITNNKKFNLKFTFNGVYIIREKDIVVFYQAFGLCWCIGDTFVNVLVLFSSNRLIYLFSITNNKKFNFKFTFYRVYIIRQRKIVVYYHFCCLCWWTGGFTFDNGNLSLFWSSRLIFLDTINNRMK